MSRAVLVSLALLLSSSAFAAPGDLESPLVIPGVTLHDADGNSDGFGAHAGPHTQLLPSPAVASTDAGAVAAPPRFSHDEVRHAWRLELSGRLRRPTWAGNLIFVIFDLADPTAVEERRYAALYQAHTPRVSTVAASMRLVEEDGFEPGHAYRVRVAQLVGGREVVLAETDVVLE